MNEEIQNIQIPLKFLNRRPKIIHSDGELDNFIKSTILEWSEKDFTCPNAIQNYIYKTIEPHSMKLYFSQCYKNIHSMKIHIDLVQTVNSHIWALFSTRPAVTFLDIYKMIEAICTNGQLRLLGPLTKIPIVKSYIFGNRDINSPTPEIRLSDLICDCANFLSEKINTKKNPNELQVVTSQSEKQFLHFLINKYHVNNFSLLGIKILNFPALRNAAYAAKCESFHKLISNEKLTKLLRNDVKKAIKNIKSNLSTNKIFMVDDKPIKNILEFAGLPFSDAIKRFFQPFLDEQEKIYANHDLDLRQDGSEDGNLISSVQNIIAFLKKEKLYGRLFQLAAIVGSMHQSKSLLKNVPINESDQPIIPTSQLVVGEWRSKLFCPLLLDINSFTLLYLTNLDNIGSCGAKLENLKKKILDRCGQICQLFSSDILADPKSFPIKIAKYKIVQLNSLSNCCRSIGEKFSEFDCVKDKEQCARFCVDFLAQLNNLVVFVLSKCKISTISPLKSNTTTKIGTELIDYIFKSKVVEYIKGKLIEGRSNIPLKIVLRLERDILKILNLSAWPLDGSFLNFFIKNRDLVCQIFDEERKTISTNLESINQEIEIEISHEEKSICRCIGIREEFIDDLMRRLPDSSITLDNFIDQILVTMNGVQMTSTSVQSITELWKKHEHYQQHFHEDGLAGAIDLTMKTVAANRVGSLNDISITNPDHVMRKISTIPLLDNVCYATKWNEVYRFCWGDICKFVNDHSSLAVDYNVRLVQSEQGVLRIHCRIDWDVFNNQIKSMVTGDVESRLWLNGVRHIIGECIAILIKASSGSSLQLCQLIDVLSINMMEKDCQKEIIFERFSQAAITMAPPEIITDILCNLVYPLAKRVISGSAELDNALKSILLPIDASFLSVLKVNLMSDHPLLLLAKHIDSQSSSVLQTQSIAIQNPSQSNRTENLNDFLLLTSDNNNSSHQKDNDEEMMESNLTIDWCESDKQRIVDDIRLSEFGVGLRLGDDVHQKIVENFNRKMGRLVEHLSNDLYANESHFVLELIQNADDNKYSASTRAQLDLLWRNTTDRGLILEVTNNELGFTESDLRSLCDIGASTKSELRANKIGRKGIGFKSVFLVSNSPEIHSNGFHVKFEKLGLENENGVVSNNGLIPIWCGKPNGLSHQRNSTMILLPIIASLENNILQSVDGQIKPCLLLFLRNLRRISVTSPTDNGETRVRFIELVTEECSHNRRVVVNETGKKFSWLVRTEKMPIINTSLQEISPRGLSCTELSIAIPADDQHNESSHDWPAFAFLPIRSYGLRFIVNGDFVIPASREDIVNESQWNKWLIDQAAEVFTRHLLDYITSSIPICYRYLTRLIECVPLPGEIPGDSSFHALIAKLRSNLTNMPWLPDRYDNVHAPSKLIIESFDDSRLTEVLCHRLQVNLLHPAIGCHPDERVVRVLSWLGCQSLSLSHLSQLLSVLEQNDFTNQSLIKSILEALHSALDKDSSVVTINRVIVQLCSLPIWPVITQNGDRYVRIDQSEVPIFFPPSHWISSSVNSDHYSLLRLVISPDFISSFQKKSNKHINVAVSILQRLGVTELSNTSMINVAIVPFLCQPKIDNISRQWLVAVAQFLIDQCHPSQYMDTVIPKMSFATISYESSPGSGTPTVSSYADLSAIHLPTSIQSNGNVLHLLRNNIDFVVIDDIYINSCSSIKPNQWMDFFVAAGVTETFYIVPSERDEISFPEIERLLGLKNKRISIDLLRYLDLNWTQFARLRSPFLLKQFQTFNSIPVCASSNDLNQPDQLLEMSLPMAKPRDTVYVTSSEPNKIVMPDSLLRHFPVCPVIFSNNSLPQNLGMSNQIGVEHVMKLLIKVFMEKSVDLTGRQSRDLYWWMKHNLSRVALEQIFSHLKSVLNSAMLVAVPQETDEECCELILDQFCYWTLPIFANATTKHVFVQDQQVFEDLKALVQIGPNSSLNMVAGNRSRPTRALVNLFPDLKELFVDIVGVREFPRVADVWNTLENVLNLLGSDRLKDLNFVEIELITDVYNIVKFLDQNDEHGRHRSDLLKMRLIPCLSGRYRSFHENSQQFSIYSWRSFHNVHAFQQHSLNDLEEHAEPSIDFVAINCFANQKNVGTSSYFNNNPNRLHRWTASEFLSQYFNLPVLEDEMCYRVDNRQSFQPSKDVQSILHHLEVIVTQWFQRNVQKDGVSHCINLLSSISRFYSSPEDVSVSVFLRNQPKIGYQYSENIYIGNVDQGPNKDLELLVGGIDLQSDGMQALDVVMSALIHWILKGDRYNHLRERFRKFYRSLFDLIESSDRNQVSIFIRSHNLRINPFSIDYIYDRFASDRQKIELDSVPVYDPCVRESSSSSSSPAASVHGEEESTMEDNVAGVAEEQNNNPMAEKNIKSDRKLKRRICVSIENVVPEKQIRLEVESASCSAEFGENQRLFPSIGISDTNQFEGVGKSESVTRITTANNCSEENVVYRHKSSESNRPELSLSSASSPLSLRMREQFSNHKQFRLSVTECAPEHLAQISGRIGEQLAFQKLTVTQRLGEWEILKVDWINQYKETRLPYDFKLSARRPDSGRIEVIYLEVKATTQPNKTQFDLSAQEVTAAWSFKEHYHLLLIFHSGNYPDERTKFVHIPDTLGQLKDNQCKLLFDVKSILEQANS